MGRGNGHKSSTGFLPAPGQHGSDDSMSSSTSYVGDVFDIDSYVSDEATPDKPLKGQQFALTGLFTGKERFQLEKDLRAKGAIIRNRVAPELRALIIGETIGDESPKMRWAKRNGVQMVSWDDFARSFYADDADLIAKLDEAAKNAAAVAAAPAPVAAPTPAPAPVTPPGSFSATPDDDADALISDLEQTFDVKISEDGITLPNGSVMTGFNTVVPAGSVPQIADDEIVYCECGAVATVHVPGGFSYCATCANLPAGHEPDEDEEIETEDESATPTYQFDEGDALAGECYVIAGTISGIAAGELTARLQAQGAIVADTVTIGVDAVIKGDNLGDDDYQAKLDAAERYEVPLVSYDEIKKHL